MIFKFAFVVGCLFLVLITYKICVSKRDWAWLVGGLTFTVIADYFLVLHDAHMPGVAVFSFVHVCYILRGLDVIRPVKLLNIVYLFSFVISMIFVSYYFDSIIILAVLYACLFIISIVINMWAFSKNDNTHLPKRNHALVLVGIILFALCDINVLLFNLPRFVYGFDFGISNIAFALIWVFYLPSQLLLSVSGITLPKAKE